HQAANNEQPFARRELTRVDHCSAVCLHDVRAVWGHDEFSSASAPPQSSLLRVQTSENSPMLRSRSLCLLLQAALTYISRSSHLGPCWSVVFPHLRRKRLGQAQLAARNHVNAHWISQTGNLQLQRRIQRRGCNLFRFDFLQLKA